MKRVICMVVLLLAGMIFVTGSGYAEEKDPVDEVLETFYEDTGSVTVLTSGDVSMIGTLSVSQTWEDEISYIWDEDMLVSGIAEAGDQVMLVVYTTAEQDDPVIWFQEAVTIGASGILERTVDISLIGEQYLLIGVTHEEETFVREYTICRKSTEIRDTLLNYQLNLYEAYGQP